MLAIRMQRIGRKGHAQFRVVVQDSRFHPSSGRVVAYLGNYNPHTKAAQIDKDRLGAYLTNGAQPSPRVIKLLKEEKVTLPAWIKGSDPKKKNVRNPDKRRSTRPATEAPATESSPPEEVAEVDSKPATEAEFPQERSTDAESGTTQNEPEPDEPVQPEEPQKTEEQPEPAPEPEKPAE